MNELQAFEKHLRENEKSPATIEKYLRDARAFLCWLDGRKPTKELTVCYKEGLIARYEAASVNSMLAGINSYLSFSGRADCRVKPLRAQRTLFGSEERELSREEYARLVPVSYTHLTALFRRYNTDMNGSMRRPRRCCSVPVCRISVSYTHLA